MRSRIEKGSMVYFKTTYPIFGESGVLSWEGFRGSIRDAIETMFWNDLEHHLKDKGREDLLGALYDCEIEIAVSATGDPEFVLSITKGERHGIADGS